MVLLRASIGTVAFILLGALAISTMVNAPGILVGYGLIYAVQYYALLAYTPGSAVIYFLAAHMLALPILIYTKSVFMIVALASFLLRTPALYALGRLKPKIGSIGLAISLAGLEQLLALSIAILYYGDDGIHTGLAIYGLFLAPFTYSIYRFNRIENNMLGAIASAILLVGYWLSAYAFLSVPLLIASVVGLILLNAPKLGVSRTWLGLGAIILVVLGAVTSGTPFVYNAKSAFYPFNPDNWSDDRWSQKEPGLCPNTTNVFENTHSPPRLRIIDSCMTVEGVVKPVPAIVGDGDYCFDLEVNDTSLLSIGNMILRKNGLHVEVVPADHFKVLGEIGGVCPGDVVKVTGVFVIDTDHGMWSEIHPAYKIEIIKKAENQTWPDCIRGKMYEGG